MKDDKIINNLNVKIIKNKKKIKNLRIRDDIIGFIPMLILSGTFSAIYFKNYYNYLVNQLYPMTIIVSLIIGGIPSTYLPTEKTKNKIQIYQNEIKDSLDKLHEYAIEEDKKRMIKKM